MQKVERKGEKIKANIDDMIATNLRFLPAAKRHGHAQVHVVVVEYFLVVRTFTWPQ